MNIFKVVAALLSTFALSNATEIEPFGQFKFGDTITPIYNKLCSINGITTIRVGRSQPIGRDELCINKENLIQRIAESGDDRFGPSMSLKSKIGIKGFENISKYVLRISADGININNVEYSLNLDLGETTREELVVGSYLMTKNDTIKINNLYIPIQLQRVWLVAKDESQAQLHSQEIFNLVWKKYGHLVSNQADRKRFQNGRFINFRAKDNTSLSFSPRAITYDGAFYLNVSRIAKLKSYIQSLPTSKNDLSNSL